MFWKQWASGAFREIGWLIVRVAFGLLLMTHGYAKLFGVTQSGGKVIEGFAKSMVEPLGFPAPLFFSYLAALSEFVGGLFIALGLFTPLAAVAAAGTMLVAILHHMGQGDPLKVFELALIYLAIAIGAMLIGGGRYSLDRILRTPFRPAEPQAPPTP
ncbi:DoxX family protein [bacterium]|nr:DoxX family protein [bacterium]